MFDMCSAERVSAMAFKKRYINRQADQGDLELCKSAKRQCLGTPSSSSSSATSLTSPNTLSSPASSNLSSSAEEIDAQSSDTGTDIYSNSTWYPDTSSSESSMGLTAADDMYDCNIISSLRHGSVTLSLAGTNLWYKFYKLGTEMIINRPGRRMFPSIEFTLRGLEPTGIYDVILDIIPASDYCFKFIDNKWRAVGEAETEFGNKPYRHQDSPLCGSDWMAKNISFQDVKLANKSGDDSSIFVLRTFQKYLVRISLIKHEREASLKVEFPISATTFVAVSAYNNRAITELKIDSNPYSKAFRMKVSSSKQKGFKHHDKGISKLSRTKAMERNIKESHFSQRILPRNTRQGHIHHVESKRDQATQTDVSMADFNLWYKFLLCPLASSFRTLTPSLALSRYRDAIPDENLRTCNDGHFLNQRPSVHTTQPSFRGAIQHEDEDNG